MIHSQDRMAFAGRLLIVFTGRARHRIGNPGETRQASVHSITHGRGTVTKLDYLASLRLPAGPVALP